MSSSDSLGGAPTPCVDASDSDGIAGPDLPAAASAAAIVPRRRRRRTPPRRGNFGALLVVDGRMDSSAAPSPELSQRVAEGAVMSIVGFCDCEWLFEETTAEAAVRYQSAAISDASSSRAAPVGLYPVCCIKGFLVAPICSASGRGSGCQ